MALEDNNKTLLYDSYICRLCAGENTNATNLFPNLSELVNKYLPLKVENDGKLPTKICPGCNIQLEATKSFMDLIVDGQTKLRELYKLQQSKLARQEKQRQQLEEALKQVNPTSKVDTYTIQSDETGEKFLIQIFSPGPLFPTDHELCLKSLGLEKPKRKRGRPPKQPIVNQETKEIDENLEQSKTENGIIEDGDDEDDDGKKKRRIKAPNLYTGVIQGKELDKIFKEEGVIDEESLSENNSENEEDGVDEVAKDKGIEVIGRIVDSDGEKIGEPITVKKSSSKVQFKSSRKRQKFQCEICLKEFLHFGRYNLHKSLHDIQYSCGMENCDFKTSIYINLEQHQKETGHIGKKASEKIAEIGVLELPQVPKNNEVVTTEETPKNKVYSCQMCKKMFSCKQNYEVHVRSVHLKQRPFQCEHCQRNFSHSKSLRLHLMAHNKTNIGTYKCTSCPKTFRYSSSLQYHRDSEHSNGRKFVCNKCDKPFKNRQLLQRHQVVHSDERPYMCSYCSSAFKTKPHLSHHVTTVHVGVRRHWCSQCGKAFTHMTTLRLHERWHAGIRPYQCDICKKMFSQKGNLAEHRRIHTGEKPFQCTYCNKAFTTSSQFRLHTNRHLGVKPYQCEHCLKSFLNRDTLKAHVRRHFDERPYRCQYCTKCFSESWALKKHERLHTGERPYHCDLCPKTFADNSNLGKHKRTHRNNKLVVESQTTTTTTTNNPLTIEVQQLVDSDGNPITVTTEDGQQINVVSSIENGQETIQGLLPDGTLTPLNITSSQEGAQNNLPIVEGELLLENNIQYLSDQDSKDNIQLISHEDVCYLSYDINNQEYLTIN